MQQSLEFLTTSGCHLCEEALDLLMAIPQLAGVTLVTIDVADHPTLLNDYGTQIPVLRCGDATLCWPFSAADVQQFFQSQTV